MSVDPIRLRGSMPALVTPFADGAVDEAALRGLVEWQIAEGSHGLVACGTTGESPSLTREEHLRVVRLVKETAAGRVPVVAGASSNCTATAAALAEACAEAGADALLVVAPYYNKPTQEGLFRHFEAVAAATDLPLVVYNVPGRTVSDVKPATLARLAALPTVTAVKDATSDLARASRHRRDIGPDFTLLSGEDASALGFVAHGGHGCISVTANVAPGLCARLMDAALAGDYATALECQDRLIDLHDALFLETSPAPAKYALSLLGKCREDLRLPLVPVGNDTRAAVRAALAAAGLA